MSNQLNIASDLDAAPLPPSIFHTADDFQKKEKDAYPNASGTTEDVVISTGPAMLDSDEPRLATDEEMATLRKVAGPMPWVGVFMCLVEFSERASYYGCSGPFNNFINNPLPVGGNGAGAVAPGAAGLNESAGALGLGSVAASAVTNTFTFLAYVVPIYGGIVADTKWGRFKTICVGTFVGAIAHVILVIPAIPSVIAHPNGSLGGFMVSILILSGAAGFIKPSLGPLLCDQSPVKKPTIKVLKSGEKVIVDPQVTVQSYLLIFYACINIGAFFAVATSYAERFVGFWLAYLLPGILYMLMPIVLAIGYKRLYKAPPQGSVLVETMKVFRVLLGNGGWKKMLSKAKTPEGDSAFWVRAKPSYIRETEGSVDLEKVFWDDKFVDEIKQSIYACQVFLVTPIFVLADGGIGNQLNDMSVAMTLDGAPNDLISNFNPLAIIVFSPIVAYVILPFFQRIGKPLGPMTRICIGFILASIGCLISTLVQWRIYKTSPCGYYATNCPAGVSPVPLWWQIPVYFFPAVGELFCYVTTYEIAYTRSPARMKGLVYALSLLNSAIGSAISLALADVIQDPNLHIVWAVLTAVTFFSAFIFPTYFKHLDKPMLDFADVDRQAGLQQPKVLAEDEEAEAAARQSEK